MNLMLENYITGNVMPKGNFAFRVYQTHQRVI